MMMNWRTTTMARKNNGINISAMIEEYNNIFTQIGRAKTVDGIRNASGVAKRFISAYKTVDTDMVNRVYDKLKEKLSELMAENDYVYERATKKVEEIKNRAYDFKGEKDDSQQVQATAL